MGSQQDFKLKIDFLFLMTNFKEKDIPKLSYNGFYHKEKEDKNKSAIVLGSSRKKMIRSWSLKVLGGHGVEVEEYSSK